MSARRVASMAVGTLVSRVLGFARSLMLVAVIGGTSSVVGGQAFSVANELPVNLYNLIAGGLLGAMLLPHLVHANRIGDRQTVERLLTMTLLGAALLTVVLVVAAPILVRSYAWNWPPTWLSLTTAMAYWCLPQVFFYIAFTVWGQYLNARDVYGPVAWVPAASNLIAIGGLALFVVALPSGEGPPGSWTPQMIEVLCGSTTLGVVVQAVLLVIWMRRSDGRPKLRLGFGGLGGASRIAGFAFAGVLAGQLAYLLVSNVCNAAAASLHSSGVNGASLNSLGNAYLVMLVPHGVLVVSIATASFTRMSRHASAGDLGEVRHELSVASRQIGYLCTLASTLFLAAGPLIGEVLWRQPVIGTVLAVLGIGLVGFSEMYLINRAALAVGDGWSLLWTQATVAFITAGGAVLAAWLLPPGGVVVGAAAAISAANLAGWALASALLRRRLRRDGTATVPTDRTVTDHIRFAGAAIAGLGAGLAILVWTPAPATWIAQLLHLALVLAVATAAFAITAWLARDRQLPLLVAAARRKAARV